MGRRKLRNCIHIKEVAAIYCLYSTKNVSCANNEGRSVNERKEEQEKKDKSAGTFNS